MLNGAKMWITNGSIADVADVWARVRIELGSEPLSGSVRPKHPTASPAAMRGSHCCFCSSEPHFQIANMASEPWTDTSERTPESPASSSMQARP